MNKKQQIFWVKFIHSFLFFLMTMCICYVLYSGVVNRVTWLTLLSIFLVLGEGIVLAVAGWRCPLTTLAERYGAESGSVTDIFLPGWLARWVFVVWGAVFLGSCVLLLARRVTGY